MAEAFAACTQPVCDIGKWLWARIATRINYARKLSRNREVLFEKAHELSLRGKDIDAEIERSKPQKIATNECNDWIGKVQKMATKVETIRPQLNEEKRCVGGLCLDIFARIELGKGVVNMINDINELLDKSKFERVVDAPVATVENQPDPPSTLAKSANRTLDMVLDKIQHKSTLKIGIWGMGGVGKTTVLRLLNNTSEIARIFDFVIWVTVSKSQSIRMIQKEVGQRLSVPVTEGESDDRVANKLRQKLNGKKYLLLSFLGFDFRRVGNLQHFLENSRSWKEGRLAQFWFFVGDCGGFIQTIMLVLYMYNMCLFYDVGEERDSGLPSAIQDVLRRSNGFGLRGHEKLSTLLDVGAHNTYELKCCMIERCAALQKIIDRNGLEMGAFPKLEVLFLHYLPELKTILCLEMEEGALLPPLPPNANIFTNLTHLTLWSCPLIEQVFSSGFMVQQLSNLKELYLIRCEGLKGMIPEDEIVEHEALPKLRILRLEDLPEFVSFFKGVPMRWQSLEEVRITNCPKLRKLPFDTNSAPNLKEIGCDSQWWWDALEWDNDATRLQFQPFLRWA